MTPLCPLCGGQSGEAALRWVRRNDRFRVMRHRVCENGHVFTTHEVTAAFLAQTREQEAAERARVVRIDLWHRDARIAADPRPAAQIAAEHNITPTRVRQIRAARRGPRGNLSAIKNY